MEKSFHALKSRKAREAYVEAELVNGLAHQIRIIRQQRGWTQKQLALKLGSTQTTVSRLEDPSYGRYTIQTLLALGRVFDVAFFVRYMPFSKFMTATWNTRPENFEAIAYEDEAPSIQFFTESKSGAYIKKVISGTARTDYAVLRVVDKSSTGILSQRKVKEDYIDFFVSAITYGGNLTKNIEHKVIGD